MFIVTGRLSVCTLIGKYGGGGGGGGGDDDDDDDEAEKEDNFDTTTITVGDVVVSYIPMCVSVLI